MRFAGEFDAATVHRSVLRRRRGFNTVLDYVEDASRVA